MKRSLFRELERRNVLKVAVGYLVTAWLLAQVADLALGSFAVPDWTLRALVVCLAIGFPIALYLSWSFEMTQRGVIREEEVDRTVKFSDNSGRRVDLILLIIVAVVIVFMGLERFVFSKRYDRSTEIRRDNPAVQTEAPGNASTVEVVAPAGSPAPIAVLPFALLSNGPDDRYFADGLSGEIIDALNHAPDLQVTARASAFRFRGDTLPLEETARRLGVTAVVEGTVHRAGERLQITARLVNAVDGAPVWSQTYETTSDDRAAAQIDIAGKVAAALGVSLTDAWRGRMNAFLGQDVTGLIAYQKGLEYHDRALRAPNRISLLRQANAQFEAAWDRAPGQADAYLLHADLHRGVLVSDAAGRLNGEITRTDVDTAPEALQQDFDRALRHARTPGESANARFEQALWMGDWRGLAELARQAASAPGCGLPDTLHLLTAFPNLAEPALEGLERVGRCDPYRADTLKQLTDAELLLGHTESALARARSGHDRLGDPSLARQAARALALLGRHDDAGAAAQTAIRAEDERLAAQSLLAAIRGDAGASRRHEEDWLGRYGPSDREGLVWAAARGERADANRLAARIDSRPFGYIVLLEAILACSCGAPFDLASTPHFAARLEGSGLEWPPLYPYPLPLKSW